MAAQPTTWGSESTGRTPIRYGAQCLQRENGQPLTVACGGQSDRPTILRRSAGDLGAQSSGEESCISPRELIRADDGNQISIPSNVIFERRRPRPDDSPFRYRFTADQSGRQRLLVDGVDVGDLSGVMNMTCVTQNTGAVPNRRSDATVHRSPCSSLLLLERRLPAWQWAPAFVDWITPRKGSCKIAQAVTTTN